MIHIVKRGQWNNCLSPRMVVRVYGCRVNPAASPTPTHGYNSGEVIKRRYLLQKAGKIGKNT